MLVNTCVSLVLVVISEVRVTEAAVALVVGSKVFLRSPSFLFTAVAFDAVWSVELFAAVLANVASVTGVKAHVEGHRSQ